MTDDRRLIEDYLPIADISVEASGEPLDVSVDDYLAMHAEVLNLMDAFRTQLENACIQKEYLRQVASVGSAQAAAPVAVSGH